MKSIIYFIIILFANCSVYSQDLIKELQKLTLENDSLKKQVIKPLKDSIKQINQTNKADLQQIQIQLISLENEKRELNEKLKKNELTIADLGKSKIKLERDSLQRETVRLNAVIIDLNKNIQEKDNKVNEERRSGEIKAKAERENGKREVLQNLVSRYLNKQFDDFLRTSSKNSIQEDIKLLGNSIEIKSVLLDLEKYFNAQELLSKKYDPDLIKTTEAELNQVKQKSELLEKLKENIRYYKVFSDNLRKTVGKLIELDKAKEAGSDLNTQKMKFSEIITYLSDYMYNYYDYVNYPYLSEIVNEIIKRKSGKADANIEDLLTKL